MTIDDLKKNYSRFNLSASLANLKENDKYKFISDVLIVMSKWTESKLNHFWKEGEEKVTLDGWVECLQMLTPASILRALESIRDCNYRKYEDCVPRSPLDFKYFLLNGYHNQKPSENVNKTKEEEDFYCLRNDQVAEEYFKKFREMLKCKPRRVGA